jgi:hypothetical protein
MKENRKAKIENGKGKNLGAPEGADAWCTGLRPA